MSNQLIDFRMAKPELATAFAQGYEGSKLSREQSRLSDLRAQTAEQNLVGGAQDIEMGGLKLSQLQEDRQAMIGLQDQLKAAGKDTNLDNYMDMMIATGRPDMVENGLLGKEKLRQQRLIEQRQNASANEERQRQLQVQNVMSGGGGMAMPLATPPRANALAPSAAMPTAPSNALAAPSSAPVASSNALAPAPGMPNAAAPGMPNAVAPAMQATGVDPRIMQVAQLRQLAAMGNPRAGAAANEIQKAIEFDQKQNPTMELKDRFVPVGKNVFDRQTQKFVSPPTPDDVSEIIPTLEKGEKWNSDTQRVEAVPGSKLYITQNSKQNKDLQTVKGVNTKTEQALAKIDEIIDPKNASAFAGNFGGYNAYASQMLPGENSNLRKKIDSFKSNMKAVGLELMRSGGSIGQMTEKEWPIVEQMIGALDPVMGEEDARIAFQKIKARMQRIADDANEIYDNNWSDTQYYAPDKKGGSAKSMSAEDKAALNWANTNANDPRAAEIKRRLGM
jgi:hypothetical protein